MGLNPRQIGKVKTAIKQLELPDDIYREILTELGVRSCKDLDNGGLDQLFAVFRQLGFHDTTDRGEQYGDDRAGMASAGQINYLRHLWKRWASTGGLEGFGHWLERSYGVSSARFLTEADARRAIEGLKAMNRRKATTGGAKGE